MIKQVIVYDKDHCPKCLHTEMQLKARGISFETKNIFDEENANILEWAQATGNRTMPLVFIDGEFGWGDNRPDKVEELAKLVKQDDEEELYWYCHNGYVWYQNVGRYFRRKTYRGEDCWFRFKFNRRLYYCWSFLIRMIK